MNAERPPQDRSVAAATGVAPAETAAAKAPSTPSRGSTVQARVTPDHPHAPVGCAGEQTGGALSADTIRLVLATRTGGRRTATSAPVAGRPSCGRLRLGLTSAAGCVTQEDDLRRQLPSGAACCAPPELATRCLGRLGECPGETVRETLGAWTRQHRSTCYSVNIPLATLSLVLTGGFGKTGDGYQPHLNRANVAPGRVVGER